MPDWKALKVWRTMHASTSNHLPDSISEQLLSRNVKRFQGELVFKANRSVYHPTLGWRVMQKKQKDHLPVFWLKSTPT